MATKDSSSDEAITKGRSVRTIVSTKERFPEGEKTHVQQAARRVSARIRTEDTRTLENPQGMRHVRQARALSPAERKLSDSRHHPREWLFSSGEDGPTASAR